MTDTHPEREAAVDHLRNGAVQVATVHALLYIGDQIGTVVTGAIAHALHLREKDFDAIRKHDAQLVAALEKALGKRQ